MTELPQDVIDFLNEEIKDDTMQEGDVTTAMLAELHNISTDAARSRLKKLVKEGKMTEHVGILDTGKRGKFYRIVRPAVSDNTPAPSGAVPAS